MKSVLSFFGANEFLHTGGDPKKNNGGANDTKDF